MGSIVIKINNNKNLQLLTALAKQLGETVNKLTPFASRRLATWLVNEKEKTGKTVSRKAICKHLDS